MFNEKIIDLLNLYEKDKEIIERACFCARSVESSLPNIFFEQIPIKEEFKYHSIVHLRTVAATAAYIAIKNGNNPINAAFSGWFHDIGRINDTGKEDGHDVRSIEIFRLLHSKDLSYISRFDAEEICNAILCHDAVDCRRFDSLSGCLRDADRIYLTRVQNVDVKKKCINTRVGDRLFLLDSLTRIYDESFFEKESLLLKNCFHITKAKNLKKIMEEGLKPSKKDFSHLKDRLFFSLNPNSIMGRGAGCSFIMPYLMRREVTVEDHIDHIDPEHFVCLKFNINYSDIESWDVSSSKDSFSTKRIVTPNEISKIEYIGPLNINVPKDINEFSFPHYTTDISISENNNKKPTYPFYKMFDKTEPTKVISNFVDDYSFSFFKELMTIESRIIVHFERITIKESFSGLGNIINICNKNKDPVFFFGELGFYECSNNFSIGMHNGIDWINNDFRIIGTNQGVEKSIVLSLIIRENEISLFVKPFGKNVTPLLLKNDKLKTSQNLLGNSIYMGSANKNYRSALVECGDIKIFPCPKNIEEELKCVVC